MATISAFYYINRRRKSTYLDPAFFFPNPQVLLFSVLFRFSKDGSYFAMTSAVSLNAQAMKIYA
jgi:hypothetical protein